MSHICQWCFEEPAIEGKKICQTCLDSSLRELQENQDFDLDKWLEGDKIMNKILIVVDCQNDFIYGALGTPEARAIVDNVLQKCIDARKSGDTIIFTKDLHYKEDYSDTIEGKCVPPHCIANENGHWILPELSPYIDFTATKSTYGYQFWGDWHHMFEEAQMIELCGVCTDICVISNALILRSMYPSTLIRVDASCCAGLTPEKHKAALEVMKSCNVEVINE